MEANILAELSQLGPFGAVIGVLGYLLLKDRRANNGNRRAAHPTTLQLLSDIRDNTDAMKKDLAANLRRTEDIWKKVDSR